MILGCQNKFSMILEYQPLREKCPKTGKYGPEKPSFLDSFHAVIGYSLHQHSMPISEF